MKKEIYITPQEILGKYPELEAKFNWNESDLGTLLKCRVLEGYYDRSKRNSMIKESSLKKLIEYTNSVLEFQKVKI